jgi:DNA polymerase III subunit epsilon
MARQIILDTETTGLEPKQGHKIIEIGCVEMQNRRLTNNHWHHYINPDREIDIGAFEVHGISNEFVQGKPRFHELAESFLEYINGAELVIHNASFDIGFLNHELSLLDGEWPLIEDICTVTDTLKMAREKHPGQKNNLDALCRRYEIDNSSRTLHGALLDAEILAEVYLAMTGGQTLLSLDAEDDSDHAHEPLVAISNVQLDLPVWSVPESDKQAHEDYLKYLEEGSASVAW